MDRQHVEVLAIGAGPANLALGGRRRGVAPELADSTLMLERHATSSGSATCCCRGRAARCPSSRTW